MRIRFDKIDRFDGVYDGNRCLVLFGPEKYDVIFNRIRYLVGLKSSITYVNSYIMQKSEMIQSHMIMILCP